jgi:hypothetical protein
MPTYTYLNLCLSTTNQPTYPLIHDLPLNYLASYLASYYLSTTYVLIYLPTHLFTYLPTYIMLTQNQPTSYPSTYIRLTHNQPTYLPINIIYVFTCVWGVGFKLSSLHQHMTSMTWTLK